jgi:preprotein translocase subunit SecG
MMRLLTLLLVALAVAGAVLLRPTLGAAAHSNAGHEEWTIVVAGDEWIGVATP